ncbi:MAG: polysaccharide export protein [Planctomycetes bacterium]|nr:polysaccharide export protein [Planctomycetota bacterium]
MRSLWGLWGLAILAGCGGTTAVVPPNMPAVPVECVPQPVSEIPQAGDPELTLIPGDVIEIRVYGEPSLTLSYRIPQDGAMRYPLIGNVQVAGKTTSHLEERLTNALDKDYLVDPQVSVSLVQPAPRRAYVMGAVREPGAYEMPPDGRLTVAQALSLAGGLSEEAAGPEIHVQRLEGEQPRTIRIALSGGMPTHLFLRPGDVVIAPLTPRTVYVLGAVNQPGAHRIPLNGRLTVAQAISMAGGFTKFAASGRVQVARAAEPDRNVVYRVDVDAILQGDVEKDVELRPGDIVFIPERLF